MERNNIESEEIAKNISSITFNSGNLSEATRRIVNIYSKNQIIHDPMGISNKKVGNLVGIMLELLYKSTDEEDVENMRVGEMESWKTYENMIIESYSIRSNLSKLRISSDHDNKIKTISYAQRNGFSKMNLSSL